MRLFIALLAAFIFSSCASVIHGGPMQTVRIGSTPPAAQAVIDGQQTVATPAFVQLTRTSPHVIVLSKTGYDTESIQLDPGISGWVFGNIIFGPIGIIGAVIDISDGAVYTLNSSSVWVDLASVQPQMKKKQ